LTFHAEHVEVHEQILQQQSNSVAEALFGSATDLQGLESRAVVASANADACAHAFVMVINPVLQVLRESSGLDILETGPELQAGVRLGRLLWLLADHVRHHHQLSRIGLNHLMISADVDSKHYGEVLAGLRINAKSPSAARTAIIRYAKSTYAEFEIDLLRIGQDLYQSRFPSSRS
jgi:hypothetical protein